MAVAVTCPECLDRYEVSDEAAAQMIRCRRCQCPIEPKRRAEGIQAGAPPAEPLADDDELPRGRRRRPSEPRSPFPWSALWIVAVGLLFFLLAFSVGFNVWFIGQRDDPFRVQQERMRADMEAQARQKAEQDAEAARAMLKEAQRTWGTLEGRVVWRGELPKLKNLEETIRLHRLGSKIIKSSKETLLDPTWRIDPETNGVADVCISIRRPVNGLLPIHPDDKFRRDSIAVVSRTGQFAPHVSAYYPVWSDGKERGETGQRFFTRETSPFPDVIDVFADPKYNPQFDRRIGQVGIERPVECVLNPQPTPVKILSAAYSWMHASVWVFDHPYYAITKTDGTFVIPRVPTGMDVQVMAWHEAQGWLFTKDGRTMALKRGKNTLDFEMSAK